MQFLLYLPGVSGVQPDALEAAGLPTFVQGAHFQASPGPDGGRGALVAWPRPGKLECVYAHDRQTWRPAVPAGEGLPAGRYWIGLWKDRPPTPEDLARPYQEPGARVTLGDGREWLLPRAGELPRQLLLADDGTWRYAVQREYHAFYLEALEWARFFARAKDGDTYDLVQLVEFLHRALLVNYRITPEVCDALGLFVAAGEHHPQSVLRAALTVLTMVPQAAPAAPAAQPQGGRDA